MTEKCFVLFFDASMLTAVERKNYRDFVKTIKKLGYTIIQKSVYIRYTCKRQSFIDEKKRIGKNTPSSVQVRVMCLPVSYIDNMFNVNCDKINFTLRTSIICL